MNSVADVSWCWLPLSLPFIEIPGSGRVLFLISLCVLFSSATQDNQGTAGLSEFKVSVCNHQTSSPYLQLPPLDCPWLELTYSESSCQPISYAHWGVNTCDTNEVMLWSYSHCLFVIYFLLWGHVLPMPFALTWQESVVIKMTNPASKLLSGRWGNESGLWY